MLAADKESPTLRDEFNERGYVTAQAFFSKEEMDDLIEEIKVAKTRNGVSGLNRGALVFYSNIFFYSPKLQSFLAHPRVVDLLAKIIGPDFWVRWDQAVAKGNGAGTFAWHQDNGYSRLHDMHYQLWIALTDMTPENGGLWLQPGSHKKRLSHRQEKNHVEVKEVPDSPVFIHAKAGDVVVFSSLTLHSTSPNTTPNTRWAYVAEYMSTDHFDPGIEPPYFVVARDGKPHPEFVPSYKGSESLVNRLKYVGYGWSLRKLVPNWLKSAVASKPRPTP
jgi:hypothetical protein